MKHQNPTSTPQLPSIVPEIPTIKDHKGSIKGYLGVMLHNMGTSEMFSTWSSRYILVLGGDPEGNRNKV